MKKQTQIMKQNSGWLWSIEGFTVIRCIIDHAISFQIASENLLITLQFEGDFLYKSNESTRVISPSNPTTIADVIEIINVNTSEIFISENGNLRLRLANGEELLIEPHVAYEAWQITTSDDIRIICMPSGQLAIWGIDLIP